METNHDILMDFQDIVQELTANELNEAWAILVSHRRALDKEKINNLRIGQQVLFRTQNRGEKIGFIEKIMKRRVKVRVPNGTYSISETTGKLFAEDSVLWTVNAGWIISMED